jgi:hypothetical protein
MTYTMNDVTNLARVFTGYDYDQTQNVPTTVPGTRVVSSTPPLRGCPWRSMPRATPRWRRHSWQTIPANTPGAGLKTALDTLFNHPNVGPFIGRS